MRDGAGLCELLILALPDRPAARHISPMRKEIFRMSRDEAVGFLERAPFIHVAGVSADGAPVLKTVNAVVLEGMLAFHGAPAGEKLDIVGREVVASAEEVVASIPSWFVDAERACPATTWYRSVQLHGVLAPIEDRAVKARVLAALMAKFQPEGRHVPITADHPLYKKALDGILVVGVALERLDGKAKVGQNRSPEEVARIAGHLWTRGAPGDVRAIRDLLVANDDRGVPAPEFLAAPAGVTLACAPLEREIDEVAALLAGEGWNEGIPLARIGDAQRGSTAHVLARDETGRVIASARALSDGSKHAWIFDVVTTPSWRRQGVGRALLRLLLDHPSLRGCTFVHLHTRDRTEFYARFGFRDVGQVARPFGTSTEMVLTRVRA